MIIAAASATPLFRTEALEHTRPYALGEIVLTRPRHVSVWLICFSVACLAAVAFVALASYTRTADISGQLAPVGGVLRLVSLQAGSVTRCWVHEGQTVAAGAVLFSLISERSDDTHRDSAAAMNALFESRHASLVSDLDLLARQATQHQFAQRARIVELKAEAARVTQQVALQSRRVDLDQATASRLDGLRQRGFVAPVQTQEQQTALLDQQQRLLELQRQLGNTRLAIQSAQQELHQQRLQSQRETESARRELAALETTMAEQSLQRAWEIRAPQAGTISFVLTESGQSVASGQPLAQLVPVNAPIEAELLAPSTAAGFIRIGQRVQLRYRAFAYQKFGQQGGEVREISATAFTPDARGEAHYRVRVRLDQQYIRAYGERRVLQPGAAVDASVQLERRRLYEWLLDPLYSLRDIFNAH